MVKLQSNTGAETTTTKGRAARQAWGDLPTNHPQDPGPQSATGGSCMFTRNMQHVSHFNTLQVVNANKAHQVHLARQDEMVDQEHQVC